MKHHTERPQFIGTDLAATDDHTGRVVFVPHPGRPGCGYTLIEDGEIDLFRLGLLPLLCKSCRENITQLREDA